MSEIGNVQPLRNALFDKNFDPPPPPPLVTQRNGLPYPPSIRYVTKINFYPPPTLPQSILLQDLFQTFGKKLKQINLFEINL